MGGLAIVAAWKLLFNFDYTRISIFFTILTGIIIRNPLFSEVNSCCLSFLVSGKRTVPGCHRHFRVGYQSGAVHAEDARGENLIDDVLTHRAFFKAVSDDAPQHVTSRVIDISHQLSGTLLCISRSSLVRVAEEIGFLGNSKGEQFVTGTICRNIIKPRMHCGEPGK